MENIKIMPMLIMRGVVVFPDSTVHFDVGRKMSILAVNSAMENGRMIYLAAQDDITLEQPKFKDVAPIGCIAVIKQVLKLPGDNNLRIVVKGLHRARVAECLTAEPYFTVAVDPIFARPGRPNQLRKEALLRNLRDAFDQYVTLSSGHISDDVIAAVIGDDDPGHLADYIASNLPMAWEDKQYILEQTSDNKRAEELVVLLHRECGILKYENEITAKVQHNIEENQREYYLREQLRVLGEELNGPDEDDEIEQYYGKVASLTAPDYVKDKLRKEVAKLSKMPSGAHEATVVRGYLDCCIELPWDAVTTDKIDIKKAEAILEKDHYGLKKVKQRIIEMLAVRKLAPERQGQIICLVGPPGVGKTSIASSVARCMGRKFARVSLGGVKDESEIRGHRRTYIGAMPGRLIDAIKQSGVSNPLVLLDEIDKVGSDYKGDCSSALLEALDPEQNKTFVDHFIDMPYDLSRVLFITTANDTSTIPAPLLDRMEVIELSSYTREEKFQIAKAHLVKKQIKNHGLTAKNCKIADSVIYELIDSYTREGGVRRLEREIASLCRKAAYRIALGDTDKVRITASDLKQLLGPKRYKPETVVGSADEVGVVNGLAWTSVGGELMKLEVSALPGTGKIELTGSLGDVMKESARTAVSYVRSVASEYGIDTEFYKNTDLHIHATEAAVPKDGPSAGITMAVAILSALSGRKIRHDVAMTGEISLRGKVLPIGGLKEKTMAAYRAGVKTVIIPADNEPDLSEIEPVVYENTEFVICSDMCKVLETALVSEGSITEETKSIDVLPVTAKKGSVSRAIMQGDI